MKLNNSHLAICINVVFTTKQEQRNKYVYEMYNKKIFRKECLTMKNNNSGQFQSFLASIVAHKSVQQ